MNEKLSDVVTSVSQVTDIVVEIAIASKEQSAGIEQVNLVVEQIEKVTQQNAAFSKESSAAAGSLAGQSQDLAAMVGTFQLERDASHPAAPMSPGTTEAAVDRIADEEARGSARNGAPGSGLDLQAAVQAGAHSLHGGDQLTRV